MLMSDGWQMLAVEVPGNMVVTPVELEKCELLSVPHMADPGVDVGTPKSKLVVVPFAKVLVPPAGGLGSVGREGGLVTTVCKVVDVAPASLTGPPKSMMADEDVDVVSPAGAAG